MEMGEPPAVQSAEPAMWVEARQYTGRIVTVTNDKIFDEPVYNYSRVLPFIWEEIKVPVPHRTELARAEQILIDAARRHTLQWQPGEEQLRELRLRYGVVSLDDWPRVYVRITDNWLELTVRFLVPDHGVRAVKDAVSRDVLREFAAAGIGIASATIAVVEAPPIRIAREGELQPIP
jgi:small-conductance mechanosensitive channel